MELISPLISHDFLENLFDSMAEGGIRQADYIYWSMTIDEHQNHKSLNSLLTFPGLFLRRLFH